MTELVVLRYDDQEVTFDPTVKMWNLTAMYKACGSQINKEPWRWAELDQTKELIAALEERLNPSSNLDVDEVWDSSNLPSDEVWRTRRGNMGGTWAHWQIAAAYAHYLNPDFYLQWNEWALERYQQLSGPASTVDVAALADIRERLAALEGAQAARHAAPTIVVVGRALDDLALAIVELLQSSNAPRAPREIARLLAAQGWPDLNKDRMKTRMARLAERGAIHKIGHGLYVARPWDDDTDSTA